MVCIKFILKQLFDILGIEYKFIPLTKSRRTLNYYSLWWERFYRLIEDDINRPWEYPVVWTGNSENSNRKS